MGEAKRRGTKEQRIAQSIERKAQEWAMREGMKQQAAKAEAERVRNLPPEERKAVILGGGHNRALLIAAAAGALAASGTIIAYPRIPDISESHK